MGTHELNQLMHCSAKSAVTITKEELSIDLDFTLNTIDDVDDAISKLSDMLNNETLLTETIFTICNVYGAYLGETFKKRHKGARWIYDESNPQAPTVFLEAFDKTFAFSGICYEKMIKNPSISIAEYFRRASNLMLH